MTESTELTQEEYDILMLKIFGDNPEHYEAKKALLRIVISTLYTVKRKQGSS